jgi:radical SAM superfamily enzyme YgiQ (UPF0313 family)
MIIARQNTALSLVFDHGNTYTFDPSGRLVALYVQGFYYARALSGEIKEKSWRGAVDEFDRHIRSCSREEAASVKLILKNDLEKAATDSGSGQLKVRFAGLAPADPLAEEALAVFRWLLQRLAVLEEEEQRYRELYQPISILPPDQYFPIVLQVTEGCPWNKCAFCDFYAQRAFRIRPFEEINNHIQNVATFFGQGALLRHSLFLADANAFVMKASDLLSVIDLANKAFPHVEKSDHGVLASFADVPAILAKSAVDLKRLREAGLSRLYIGMESGSNTIRKLINKPGSAINLIRAVTHLKNEGFDVGLIMMLGLGGQQQAELHVRESIEVLKTLPLSSRDVIFFSPYYPDPQSPYAAVAAEQKWQALDKKELRLQHKIIKNALQNAWAQAPRQGVYDIREFVY